MVVGIGKMENFEMWIRSQNKEVLANIKAFNIIKNKEKFWIIGYLNSVSDNFIYLGKYKTEEKAMKVLDELQCRIARSESGVFQMPEDEE